MMNRRQREPRRARERRRTPSWLATAGMLAAVAILVGGLAVALTGLSARGLSAAVPADAQAQIAASNQELDLVRAKLATVETRLERMSQVAKYSTLYGLPADLAGAIYDAAREEGIHPSLGFQLVKVESGFRPVKSNRGAIGYTQLRLATARIYDPKVSEADLYDRETNLRFGFRFLHQLLGRFDEDLQMALVAYNRGPSRVVDLLSKGEDPANGYAEAVLRKRTVGVNRGS